MGFEDGQRWLAWVQSRSLYEKLYGRTWCVERQQPVWPSDEHMTFFFENWNKVPKVWHEV